jgi:MFS family permease
LTNVAVIAVGWGVFTWIVPVYVRSQLGVGPRLIGLLVFANALTVVLAQIPVTKLAEGRRRMVAMATASVTFVVACLLVVGASLIGSDDVFAVLLAAVIIVGVGECFHTTALMPLVADLAAEALRGRYMAMMGLSWRLGLALAPTLGLQLLSVSPSAALLAAAAVAFGAGLAALALERELPPSIRLTPRPARPRTSAPATEPAA